jgi:hypothetical protein
VSTNAQLDWRAGLLPAGTGGLPLPGGQGSTASVEQTDGLPNLFLALLDAIGGPPIPASQGAAGPPPDKGSDTAEDDTDSSDETGSASPVMMLPWLESMD